MKNYLNKTIILALAIVCLLLFYRSCEIQKDYERVASALTVSDLKNQKFETELNKKGEEISTQKQLILSQEEALENNLLEIEEPLPRNQFYNIFDLLKSTYHNRFLID